MFIIKKTTAMENQDKLYQQFKDAAGKAENKSFDRIDAVWNRVEEKLDNKKYYKRASFWKYTAMAATLLLFMGIGVFMLNNEKNSPITAPATMPENNVTVIDTQKVRQTFDAPRAGEINAFVTTEKTKRQAPVYKEPMPTTEGATENTNGTNDDNAYLSKGYAGEPVEDVYSQDKKKEEGITNEEIVAEAIMAEDNSVLEEDIVVQGYLAKANAKSNSATVNTTKPIPFQSLNGTTPGISVSEMASTMTPAEKLQKDIADNKVQLYILGGIASHTYPGDDAFEAKFEISYHDFGCLAPVNMDFYSEYNFLVLKHLTNKYGTEWEKDIRKDIMGWSKWEEKE
jgi:hypothetical protein